MLTQSQTSGSSVLRSLFFIAVVVGYFPSLYYFYASFTAWLSYDPRAGDSGMAGAVIGACGIFAIIFSVPSTLALVIYFSKRKKKL